MLKKIRIPKNEKKLKDRIALMNQLRAEGKTKMVPHPTLPKTMIEVIIADLGPGKPYVATDRKIVGLATTNKNDWTAEDQQRILNRMDRKDGGTPLIIKIIDAVTCIK